MSALMGGWTVFADIAAALVFSVNLPVGGCIVKNMLFWTNNTFRILNISILVPFVAVFRGLRTFVSS